MGKYLKPIERVPDDKPKRPERCGEPDCLSLWDGKTGEHRKGFADVAIHLDGYTIYRCQYHYLERMERTGKSALAPITRGKMYFNIDDVHAHWETLNEA